MRKLFFLSVLLLGHSNMSIASTVECNEFRAKIPSTWFQDSIKVPEDYANPNGKQIEVFFYGNKIPGRTPLVFFNGGPATSSHGSFSALKEIASEEPTIFIDQRGTGCSTPYPVLNEESGPRIAFYGAREIVKDAERIRAKVMGTDPWRTFGHSYGSSVVFRYIDLYPGSLKSAFTYGLSTMTDIYEWYALRGLGSAEVAKAYFTRYPSNYETVKKVKSFYPNWCTESRDETLQVCGSGLIDLLSRTMGHHDRWPKLHSIVSRLWDDAKGAIDSMVLAEIADLLDNAYTYMAAISYMDWGLILSDPQSILKSRDILHARGVDMDSYLIHEIRYQSSITTWPKETRDFLKRILTPGFVSPRQLKEALARNPKLKLYSFSGGLDSYSPPATYREMIQALGSSLVYRNFPDSGHEGYRTLKEVWETIRATDVH